MSSSFGIRGFIAVSDNANTIRTNFVGAPAQFKALSDEYGATVPSRDKLVAD
jgi:hypothetical protein